MNRTSRQMWRPFRTGVLRIANRPGSFHLNGTSRQAVTSAPSPANRCCWATDSPLLRRKALRKTSTRGRTFQRRPSQSKPRCRRFCWEGELKVWVGNKQRKKKDEKKLQCDPGRRRARSLFFFFAADNQETHLLSKPRLNRPWSPLAILVSPAGAAWHQ